MGRFISLCEKTSDVLGRHAGGRAVGGVCEGFCPTVAHIERNRAASKGAKGATDAEGATAA